MEDWKVTKIEKYRQTKENIFFYFVLQDMNSNLVDNDNDPVYLFGRVDYHKVTRDFDICTKISYTKGYRGQKDIELTNYQKQLLLDECKKLLPANCR